MNASATERLGYPTQKPILLLQRIISAASNEGDVVLDPFCSCGTAVHAAQKPNRRWIGIDITRLAISIVERRLRDAFPGIEFEVQGTPKDLEGARELARRDKYEFQWWTCALVGAQSYQGRKKGADNGIDGLIYFQEGREATQKIIVSVKGGDNVSVAMVRDLKGVIERERAAMGVFVTLTAPTRAMRTEAAAAGYYDSPHFPQRAYSRVQILSIEGLLRGTEQPRYPDLSRGERTFKRARKEAQQPRQAALL